MDVLDEAADAVAGIELEHLADLLGEGHASDEVGDALGDGERGVLVRVGHDGSSHGGDDVGATRFGCGPNRFDASSVDGNY
ncbi:hypothetical protein CBZ_23000 [Cellulomonas biazotea]|uniref:Uncharacterized protein n=1 Tax=Cellulomonas biazotea TaxID=1709 RepID=A0A402DSZ4_9CELL|nr:hypothetical protein CBZ_23000 [Cellulomonas biazotea]